MLDEHTEPLPGGSCKVWLGAACGEKEPITVGDACSSTPPSFLERLFQVSRGRDVAF